MAYKTLYRVFRPSVFDEVYGQRHITDILKKQVETKRPSHAYLFCGPRGTGKTSTAKIFANALNCQNPQQGNPCGQCEVCASFKNDTFVDIVEIDAASNNGVDHVRDIREKVSLLPAQGKYKVYIIDEVHMLSTGAFNALLKTLEEPPAHAVFILATTELRKVPATILSRCQKYDFRRLGQEDIVARMKYVAAQTGVRYEEGALALIARQAEGAMRDALSIMDQCIAGQEELTEAAVTETMGIADNIAVAALADAVMTENPAAALLLVEQMTQEGIGAHNILRDLICALSGELVKHVKDAYQCAGILRSLEALIAVQNTLRYSNVPGAVLMAAVVRAAVNTTDVDTKDIELRLKKLEHRVEQLAKSGAQAVVRQAEAQQGAAVPKPAEKKPKQRASLQTDSPAKQPAKAAAAKEVGASVQTKEVLKQFCDGIVKSNMALLAAANVILGIEKQGGVLLLRVGEGDAPLAEMLTGTAFYEDVAAVTEEVFGERLSCRVVSEEQQAEQENDIQRELIELFGAENVDIKE